MEKGMMNNTIPIIRDHEPVADSHMYASSCTSTLSNLIFGSARLIICSTSCGIINTATTHTESIKVILQRIPVLLIDFFFPQLLINPLQLIFYLIISMIANLDVVIDVSIFRCAPVSSSLINDCETPMIHPILHVLATKILPINVRHVKIIGCRSAQLMSYSGNANIPTYCK